MLNWFFSRFRPYTQHMFKQILSFIKMKTRERQNTEMFLELESNTADAVQLDMDHIMHALQALDDAMKRDNKMYMCMNYVTMMDIIMYNELSQVLCMHALFYKSSKTYQEMHKNIEPETSNEEIEFAKIR